jgi:hypothetical protein
MRSGLRRVRSRLQGMGKSSTMKRRKRRTRRVELTRARTPKMRRFVLDEPLTIAIHAGSTT